MEAFTYKARNLMDVLPMLIDAGAKINAVNSMGETALMIEINRRDPDEEAIMYLLENDTNLSLTDSGGRTALDRALINGYDERATMLKEAETKW